MIKVLQSGFFTTIQDAGRKGYADFGVPISGAMDMFSLTLANLILQNKKTDAVLEIVFGGCKLLFLSDCFICISGADFSVKINEKSLRLNAVINVKKGSVLSFGKRNFGVRTYLAVLGGFQTKKALKSRSFYKGITEKNAVQKNDILPIKNQPKKLGNSFTSIKSNQNHFITNTIICYKGPEFSWLSNTQIQQLKNTFFTISSDNNRMGYRLHEPLENNFSSMLTAAVLPGTVQLTPSGKLIVLMRDCQVTGGYPRVLQLSENGINQLAQKTTGDIFQFIF